MAIMRAAGHSPRPIWITELGWNRAADSSSQATLGCQAVYQTMVTGLEQAAFLPQQFDILFKDVTWAPGIPAVAKTFWYQYSFRAYPDPAALSRCLSIGEVASLPPAP